MANVRSEIIYARLAYTIMQIVAGVFEPQASKEDMYSY